MTHTGPKVKEGDIVVSHIMGVGWDDKTVTTSSWGKDPSVSVAAEPRRNHDRHRDL